MLKENKTRMGLVLDMEVKKKVKIEADKMGLTMNGLINVMINDYLKQQAVVDLSGLSQFIVDSQAKQKGDPDKKANK